MDSLSQVEQMAEKLRQEPYRLFRNDCITKSRRLQKACRALGIPVAVIVCLGYARAKLWGRSPWVPVIHGWVELGGRRIETSRPLGHAGFMGIVPVTIRPLIRVRL
jgi:hypothetical protein